MEYAEQQKLRDSELHSNLLEIGRKLETTEAHKLEPIIIEGLISTFDYMGVSDGHLAQMTMDLMPQGNTYVSENRKINFVPPMHPQYKIFDWLGMMYDGRCVIGVQEDLLCFKIIELMVKHYIAMKDVGGWAWSYRGHIDLESEMDATINRMFLEKNIDNVFLFNLVKSLNAYAKILRFYPVFHTLGMALHDLSNILRNNKSDLTIEYIDTVLTYFESLFFTLTHWRVQIINKELENPNMYDASMLNDINMISLTFEGKLDTLQSDIEFF